MQLPAFTYGLTKEVKSRVSRIVTKLARGASWTDAIAGPEMDTGEGSGLIVLDGPSQLLGGAPHYHVYLPVQEVLYAMLPSRGRLPASMRATLFESFLNDAWSTLALQGRANQTWLSNPYTFQPFLRATLKYWPKFDDEPRYTAGLHQGSWLWQCNPMIHYVLINMGLPQQALGPLVRTRDELVGLLEQQGIAHDWQ